MKKILFICLFILTIFSLSSCGQNHEKYLLKQASEKISFKYNDPNLENFGDFIEKLEDFSIKLSTKLYKNSIDNYAISPISIYMALAMAIECAEENTLNEMLTAVGVTYEEVLKFTPYLYSYANAEYSSYGMFDEKKVTAFSKLSNSIWIDDGVELKELGLNVLAEKYHANSYYVPFKNNTKNANKALDDYINEMTNGLIKPNLNLSPETLFVLVDTYYLKEIWNVYGNDLKFTSSNYNFINYDGSIDNLPLLEGYYNNGKIYEEETFTHFFTTTEHNYRINFLVPKDGYSVDDVFTFENVNTISDIKSYLAVDDERKEINHTRCFFPEFEADYDKDIKDVLINDFEIKSLFTFDCNFKKITDEKVSCDGVIHKCKLTVNKKGIEGAAVTVIPAAGAPGPGEYVDVYYDYVIDRAFGFTITDARGVIVFSGVVKNI